MVSAQTWKCWATFTVREARLVESGRLLYVRVGELSDVRSAVDAVPLKVGEHRDSIDPVLRDQLPNRGSVEVGGDQLEDLLLVQPALRLEWSGLPDRSSCLTRRGLLDPRSSADQGFQGWREVTEPRGKDHHEHMFETITSVGGNSPVHESRGACLPAGSLSLLLGVQVLLLSVLTGTSVRH